MKTYLPNWSVFVLTGRIRIHWPSCKKTYQIFVCEKKKFSLFRSQEIVEVSEVITAHISLSNQTTGICIFSWDRGNIFFLPPIDRQSNRCLLIYRFSNHLFENEDISHLLNIILSSQYSLKLWCCIACANIAKLEQCYFPWYSTIPWQNLGKIWFS